MTISSLRLRCFWRPPRGDRASLGAARRQADEQRRFLDSGGMAFLETSRRRAVVVYIPLRDLRLRAPVSVPTGWASHRSSPTTSCCRGTATVLIAAPTLAHFGSCCSTRPTPNGCGTRCWSRSSRPRSRRRGVRSLRDRAPSIQGRQTVGLAIFLAYRCRRRSRSSRLPTWCSSSALFDTRWR